MNAEIFFESFDLLADAPNSVAKLRELILQLAVHGKLVPQVQADEPASKLLESIGKTNADSRYGRSKAEETESPHHQPFHVPKCWEWAEFHQIATIASNLVKPGDFGSFPHVAPDNIAKATGQLLPYRTVVEDKVRSANHRFHSGQLLYSKIRPNLAKATVIDFDGLCSADMYPIDVHIETRYLLYYMLSQPFLRMAVRNDTRVAMPKINQEELNQILVPVPPLAEQHRIVSKVDELLGLCDELETRQGARRELRERLVQAALDQLLASRDPADFATNWQRLQENFDVLFDTPTAAERLRNAILQLAISGNLVERDPKEGIGIQSIETLEHARREYWESMEIVKMRAKGISPVPDSWPKRFPALAPIETKTLHQIPEWWHSTPLTLFVNLKEVLMRQRFVVITSFITKVVRTDYYSPERNRDVASRLGCCYQRDEGQMPEAGPEMAA